MDDRFGKYLQERRRQLGLRPEALAAAMNISPIRYRGIEAGFSARRFDPEQALGLADALQVDVGELLRAAMRSG